MVKCNSKYLNAPKGIGISYFRCAVVMYKIILLQILLSYTTVSFASQLSEKQEIELYQDTAIDFLFDSKNGVSETLLTSSHPHEQTIEVKFYGLREFPISFRAFRFISLHARAPRIKFTKQLENDAKAISESVKAPFSTRKKMIYPKIDRVILFIYAASDKEKHGKIIKVLRKNELSTIMLEYNVRFHDKCELYNAVSGNGVRLMMLVIQEMEPKTIPNKCMYAAILSSYGFYNVKKIIESDIVFKNSSPDPKLDFVNVAIQVFGGTSEKKVPMQNGLSIEEVRKFFVTGQ